MSTVEISYGGVISGTQIGETVWETCGECPNVANACLGSVESMSIYDAFMVGRLRVVNTRSS